MDINRRTWLKQTGWIMAGMGIAPLKAIAAPAPGYAPGPANDTPIILRSNENPYGPSPATRQAMAAQVSASNRYNWELTTELTRALAQQHQVAPENILLGAGSTDILDLTVRLAAAKKGSFVTAEPTFNYWAETAQNLGLKKISVPLTPDKRHDLPAMLNAIKSNTRLVYLCNPNNPTGTICDPDALAGFITEASKRTLVLADEAYLDYTRQPSLSRLVAGNNNLIVAKTFSKIYGMAGARVGYALASPSTIEQLKRLLTWPNGNLAVVSTAGALAALSDTAFVSDTFQLNEKARKYTTDQLERLGIPCIPSYTNFLYFSLEKYPNDYFQRLKDHNIQGTRIYEEQGKWSRITIGTQQEMEAFIRALS